MWQDQARCANVDTDVFYPSLPGGRTAGRRDRAVQAVVTAYCDHCPVTVECLEDALSQPQQHGIWGGMSEDDRNALLRRRAVS